jgi:ribonucleoside-diphosphate reductase alpha chain
MVARAEQFGLRNLQLSVAAPTGTISFIMGADTTGIEPDFALVKFKKLAGGGFMRIVNRSVPAALAALGYDDAAIDVVMAHVLGTQTLHGDTPVSAAALTAAGFTALEVDRVNAALSSASTLDMAFGSWVVGTDAYERFGVDADADPAELLAAAGFGAADIAASSTTICGHLTTEGAPGLRPEHAAVFDCAVECGDGTRVVAAEGHVRALGAIAPFLSGSSSKTVNVPNSASIADIEGVYDLAYRLGVKCVAVYRDGSKLSQPLSSAGRVDDEGDGAGDGAVEAAVRAEAAFGESPVAFYMGSTPPRFRLPNARRGTTWRITIGGEEVYLRSGEYDDGTLGEVFIDWGRQGSTLRGITGALSIMISQALQHGMPLEKIVSSLRAHKFEPAGIVAGHDNLRMAESIVDAVVRILGYHYLGRGDLVQVPDRHDAAVVERVPDTAPAAKAPPVAAPDVEAPQGDTAADPSATFTPPTGEKVIGKACTQCGSEALVRTGSCSTCTQCGSTTGCA